MLGDTTMLNQDQFLSNLYDAALDEMSWHRVLQGLRQMFDGSDASLHIIGAGTTSIQQVEHNDSVQEVYRNHLWQRDLWVNKTKQLPNGTVITGHALCPISDFDPEFRHHIFEPMQLLDILGVNVSPTPAWFLGISISRQTSQSVFTRTDMARMTSIVGHISRAVRIRETLASQGGTLLQFDEALYHLPVGALIVDQTLQIIWANEMAESVLGQRASNALRILGRQLDWGTAREKRNLEGAVGRAINEGIGGTVRLAGREAEPTRLIDLIPLGRHFDDRADTSWVPSGARGRCLLVIRDARSAPVP